MTITRQALVIGGVVANVIMADGAFTPTAGTLVAAPSNVSPGWLYDGTNFTAPSPVAAVWEVRKLLVVERIIAAGKTTAFKALIDGLGDSDALRWAGCVTIFNNEPVAASICGALSLDVNVIMRQGEDV